MFQDVNKNQNQANQPNNQNNDKSHEKRMKKSLNQNEEVKKEKDPTNDANKPKKTRKVPEKKFSGIETDFSKTLLNCQKLSNEIDLISQHIKEGGYEIDPDGTGKNRSFYKFTGAELAGKRNLLVRKKAELRFRKSALKSISNRYTRASRRNASATKAQVMRFNNSNKMKNLAKKHSEEILNHVGKLFDELIKAKDPRIGELRNHAKSHPQKVSSIVYKIIKAEIAEKKIVDKSLHNLLAASPYMRTKIAQLVIRIIN